MVLAAEVLAGEGLRLRGDLLVNTVTDEESTGAGAIATVARGVRADAGLVPEATSFGAWVAVRGALKPTVTVHGRAGHAGIAHGPWQEGGAVNAIEKAALLQRALLDLHAEWQERDAHRHPYLSPPHLRPVVTKGGEWVVSIPAECTTTYHVTYLPGQADAGGWGAEVEAEVQARIAAACAADDWLAEHPPEVVWAKDIPPGEVAEGEPIVGTALGAVADLGLEGRPSGLDSWYDGATFTAAGTPTIALGPRRIEVAHTIDEHVPVEDLVLTAQAIAVTAMRFCGVA
jgi:acetylornithine deacetylase